MKWIVRAATGAAVISAALFGGWACSDDGGGALTLEEYFQELEDVDNETSDRTDALFENVSEDPDLDEVKDAYAGFPDIIDDFVSGLEDLNPPDEVQEEHDDAVAAARDFRAVFDDTIDQVQDAESLEDIQTIGDGEAFTAADDAFTQACLDLEAAAEANNITVDLDCEDE